MNPHRTLSEFNHSSCLEKRNGKRHAGEKWTEEEEKGKDKRDVVIAIANKYGSYCVPGTWLTTAHTVTQCILLRTV